MVSTVSPPISVGIPPQQREPIPDEESAVLDVGEFIRRHYRLVLATTLAGLLLAFSIAKIQTPLYRAVASIEIQDPNNLETQLRILHSSSLIERVLDQLEQDHPEPAPKPQAWWSPLRWVRHARPLTRDEMVDNAARNLDVRQSRQATIVDLAYESKDPQYAATFLNQLAQQYMALNSQSRQETSRSTTARLNRQLNDLRTQLERSERRLQDSYHQPGAKVSGQAENANQDGSLKRAVETNQELYGALLLRATEARLASGIHLGNARVVDEARVPRRPYKPNVTLHLLWGTTLGLLIGLVFTYGRERYAPRFQDPGELRVHLHIPELGAIPKIEVVPDGWAEPSWTHRRLQARGADPAAKIAQDTVQHPKSPVADSFRAIITSILLSKQFGRSPQVIAVTSAKAGEGKTTVTTNLAISLAQLNRRVLLIDGNLRKPRLHRIFNQVNNFGFGDLRSQADNSDLLPYVTHQTGVPNVWLATAGPRESGALDLLYSNGMATLMSSAREAFDFILIDTPAMRDLPDARILGRISDGVLMVVQSGSDRRSAKAATLRLQQDGIPVLGAVLNHWNRKS